MEKHRRVYPVRTYRGAWPKAVILVISGVLIVSGIFFRVDSTGFSLQTEPAATEILMSEAYDETMVSLEVKLDPQVWYALQVGAFETEEAARSAAQDFQRRGAAGYIWHDGRFRVMAAAYSSKEEAQTVQERLQDRHSIESYIYRIEFPAVHMRLSGMKGQLEIIQTSFDHAMQLARHLCELTELVDRKEIAMSDVIEALNAFKAQADIIVLRIEQRFELPRHDTVQAVIDCFAGYAQFVEKLSAKESNVEMGLRLKYQIFALLHDIQNIYHTLS